jgi:eukaryotic-like serine/threonine-protein kinase
MNRHDPSDADRWRDLNALLVQALSLNETERERWLQQLQAPQQQFEPLLRAMLARAAVDTGSFMQQPAAERLLASLDAADDAAGNDIGPYRLIRELGVGGMATVWLAERADGMPRRQVALKLPHLGSLAGLGERMDRERDILAALEHRHIARLYDAGIAAGGRPWLAMEHVDGQPIDVYVREQKLGLEATLRLFLQVTAAVAFAHTRLVVHSDIKPSNILVNRDGEVRLLDFGVAKLLQSEGGVQTHLTQRARRAFTPDYASPEQIRGAALTTASDVYSLAVVLYELLAGRRPYRLKRESAAALEEAITDTEVPLPSAQADDRRRARELRGDLDTIVATALRKDPGERYASVETFAADIERFLAGEPVRARPDSSWYRLRKTIGRHRGAAAATLAVVVALTAGAGAALWQGREAMRQRDQALALLARNESVSDFVTMLFMEAAPPGQAGVVTQMLERGAQMVESAYAHVPEHQAAILRILSGYFENPERAEALLVRADELTRDSPDLTLRAQIACDRGQAIEGTGRPKEAIELLDRWINDSRTPDVAMVRCLQMRGAIAANSTDAQGALHYARAALARLRTTERRNSETEAELLGDIAYALHLNGRGLEAQNMFEQSLSLYKALNRQDSANARTILANWGVADISSGDLLNALQRYDALLVSHERRAPGSAAPTPVLGNRAQALERLARWPQALQAYADTVRAGEQLNDVPGRCYGLVGTASVLLHLGRRDEARQALARAAELTRDGVLDGHPAKLRATAVQARLDLEEDRAADAHRALTGLIDAVRSRGTAEGFMAMALRLRAEAALALGRPADARADADMALAIAQRRQGGKPFSGDTGMALLALGLAQRAAGQAVEARPILEQAVEHLSQTAGPHHPDAERARRLLAEG